MTGAIFAYEFIPFRAESVLILTLDDGRWTSLTPLEWDWRSGPHPGYVP